MSRRILKLFVASLLNILYFPVIQAIYDISSTSQIAKGRYKFGFAISGSPEKANVAKLINLKNVTKEFLFSRSLKSWLERKILNLIIFCLQVLSATLRRNI